VLSFHVSLIISAVVLVSAIYDFKYRIIPNWLTYPTILIGIILSLTPYSISFIECMYGLAICFIPSFLIYVFQGIGGGDVKLLTAIGVWVGSAAAIEVMIYTVIAGSGLSLIIIILNDQFWVTIKNSFKYLFFRKAIKQDLVITIKIPFAVPIAIGTLWALILPRHII
jgi:prepilin peptidase CpaA